MKKVFISMPMRGLSDEQILENREKVIQDVRRRFGSDVMFVSSIIGGGNQVHIESDNTALKYLAMSIDMLVDADLVYFCKGYQKARGCTIEHMCALEYGKEIMYELEPGTDVDDESVLKVKLDEGAHIPVREHGTDGGIDIRSNQFGSVPANGSKVFTTGVHVEIPHGYAGLLVSKSGLNIKHQITSTGLIDEGFTGEIRVRLKNDSDNDYLISPGDKITQLVLIPVSYAKVVVVDEISGGERGDNGYGSTGK